MVMPAKGQVFLQEFVIGFGFLGGLFTWVGIDPEEQVVRALLGAFLSNNELTISIVVICIMLVSTIASILGILSMGGKLGLLCVAFAWMAGFTMPMGSSLSVLGVILLIIAMLFAPIVCER